MPRPLRVHVAGGFYHVTLRGNHRRAIFVDEGDQRLLNRIVARALTTYDARLHAYCWMSNHIHLLMQVNQEPLAKPMRSISSEFAREMQKKLDTTGHFFERRYFAALVDADAYFLELVRYIHLNPVRAGLASRAIQYPWSSHHAYLGARAEPWVTTDFALRMFARQSNAARRAYSRFVEADDASEWAPELVLKSPDTQPQPQPQPAAGVLPAHESRKPAPTLASLVDEACARFEVTIDQLTSQVRDPYVSKVRAWIASQAKSRQITGISQVARLLRRDESTLRETMRRYPRELA